MKNNRQKFVVLLCIIAITISACVPVDAAPQVQINAGGTPVATHIPGIDSGSTLIFMPNLGNFSSAALEKSYNECLAKAVNDDPSLLNTDLGAENYVQVEKVWWCHEADQVDVFLVEASVFTTIAPGYADDAVVVGTAVLYEAGKYTVFVLILIGSYVSGQYLASSRTGNHSSREHNPEIEGTYARKVIASFIAALTVYFSNGGQDPRKNCGIVTDSAGAIIRVAYLFFDQSIGTDAVVWFKNNVPGTPWGGGYPSDPTNPNYKPFENGPTLKPDQLWTVGPDVCKLLEGKVPQLQPAQPSH